MGVLLLRNTRSAPRHRFDTTIGKAPPFPRVRRTQWRTRAALFVRYLVEPIGVRRRNTRRKPRTSIYPNLSTLTEKPTDDKSINSRAWPGPPQLTPGALQSGRSAGTPSVQRCHLRRNRRSRRRHESRETPASRETDRHTPAAFRR